ncbi:hypothetical protein G9P44_004245 [Scheffersomyces stipitis]|nr:hypothetical protein G9P44_004245 [Scheffersomyces stipitis]
MEISPSALEFKGSFTKQSTQYLTLTNTTNSPLAFKVKTTAPKLYCVRPNASVIDPGRSAQISIILQGFSSPLQKDYKCKDKFLIVSLPSPDGIDASKIGESWASLEAKYKSEVISKKLRVNYVITEDEPDYNGAANNHDISTPTIPSAPQEVSQRDIDTSAIASTPAKDSSNGFASGNSFGGAAAIGAGAAALAGGAALAGSHGQPELQRELENSSAQVNNLSQRLDSNAGFPPQQQFQQQPPQQFQQSPEQQFQQQQQQPPQFQQYQQPPPQFQQYQQPPPQHYQQPPPQQQYSAPPKEKESKHQEVVKTEEPVNGISLPLAIALMVIAFLLGWLVF